ncbi:MAG: ATP-binding protein [Ignavibacteria bacterium]|nr:ATP-binding protein [Ignavibacteria bacterium]
MEYINLTTEELNIARRKIMSYLQTGLQSENPQILIVTGPIASGKTTLIRKYYADNHVWIDAGRIFIDLINSEHLSAANAAELTDLIGMLTLDLAVIEKRNIVIEMLATDESKLNEIINSFTDQAYDVKLIRISSSPEECYRNTLKREADSMSSFFSEDKIYKWISEVLRIPVKSY